MSQTAEKSQPNARKGVDVTTPSDREIRVTRGDEALNTLTFDEEDGRTTLVLTMRFENREKRDQALATGMADGIAFGYDHLDAVLEEQKLV